MVPADVGVQRAGHGGVDDLIATVGQGVGFYKTLQFITGSIFPS